ncbi:MAG: VTT domain-containing protein [Planctomycetota bacterium]|nr:VTT domain-containing protein [Planctomycetota bacterium]
MWEWASDIVALFAENPLLQGIAIALSTFVLEDPTTIGSGLLVSQGKLHFMTAFIALTMGITVGDMGLYLIGRSMGWAAVEKGIVSASRIERAKGWFDRNLVLAIVFSRFVPGMRLPTYIAAGISRASGLKFLLVALTASVVWTLLLLLLIVEFGESVLPLFGEYKWYIAVAFILFLVLVQISVGRGWFSERSKTERTTSFYEFWPPWLFYIPVFCWYMLLSIRYFSLTLPTASNPSVYSGGLLYESKSSILELVSDEHRDLVAPYIVLERSSADAQTLAKTALKRIHGAGFGLPVVAKPDIGQRGAGVQPVRDEAKLIRYIENFPQNSKLMLQKLVEYENEAAVLYYVMPSQENGEISSVTLKYFPQVTGDGERTLEQLVRDDPRACKIAHIYLDRHDDRREQVLEKGENFLLVFSGSHCQGAVFKDGTDMVSPQMRETFGEIVSGMEEFYYGRFDLRFSSLEELKQGKGFQIVEINGAGGEPTHIWDASTPIWAAYGALFRQFSVLFRLGAANRRRGHKPIGPRRLIRDFRKFFFSIRPSYPKTS